MAEAIYRNRGLSPLVRGKRGVCFDWVLDGGSIPACAGETRSRRQSQGPVWVYPRLCGGNRLIHPDFVHGWGLSPLVRGKLGCDHPVVIITGSIPACAGETETLRRAFGAAGVYPRLCGGNFDVETGEAVSWGLSPLVRGKRTVKSSDIEEKGSIPACAGETVPVGLCSTRAYGSIPACAGETLVFNIMIC